MDQIIIIIIINTIMNMDQIIIIIIIIINIIINMDQIIIIMKRQILQVEHISDSDSDSAVSSAMEVQI